MKALAILAAAALAHSAPPPRTAAPTATVVLVAELPDGAARAAVVRRATPPSDVILLTRARATVEDLAAALSLLAEARERDGPSPPLRDAVLVLKSSRLSQPLNARQRLRLDAHLARLHAARPRPVAGVGTVPAIEVNVRTRRQLR